MPKSDLPKHKITIRKQRSTKPTQQGGGPTNYPSSDTIVADVIIHVPGRGYDRYTFPFIEEKSVASIETVQLERFHDVLRDQGFEIDLSSNPVWDKTVTAVKDSGFSKGVVSDTLDENPGDEKISFGMGWMARGENQP